MESTCIVGEYSRHIAEEKTDFVPIFSVDILNFSLHPFSSTVVSISVNILLYMHFHGV